MDDNYYCLCQHRGSQHAIENGACWKCLCNGFNLDHLRYLERKSEEKDTQEIQPDL